MIQDNTQIQSIIVKLSGVSTGTIQNLLLDLAHCMQIRRALGHLTLLVKDYANNTP